LKKKIALKELIRTNTALKKVTQSTTHTLTRVTARITLGFNNNKATLAHFLDIERAFDKQWITGLISKLIKKGIPTQFIHIIHNCLSNRDS
jgi:hypothetical protein